LLFTGTFTVALVLFAVAARLPHPIEARQATETHTRATEAAG
jgi:hypothetical protein